MMYCIIGNNLVSVIKRIVGNRLRCIMYVIVLIGYSFLWKKGKEWDDFNFFK